MQKSKISDREITYNIIIFILCISQTKETPLKELFHACLGEHLSNYNVTMEQINSILPLCDTFEKAVDLPNLDIILEEAKKFQQLLNYTEQD